MNLFKPLLIALATLGCGALPGSLSAAGAATPEASRPTQNIIGYRPWRGGWATYNILLVGSASSIIELPEAARRTQFQDSFLVLEIHDRDRLMDWQDEDLLALSQQVFLTLVQAVGDAFGERQRRVRVELHLIGPRREVRTEYTEHVLPDDELQLRFVLDVATGTDPLELWRRATDLLAHELYHVSQWGRYVGDPLSSEAAAHLWGLCALSTLAASGHPLRIDLDIDGESLAALVQAHQRSRSGALRGAGAIVGRNSQLGRSLALLKLRTIIATDFLQLPDDNAALTPVCERLRSGVPPLLLEFPAMVDALIEP